MMAVDVVDVPRWLIQPKAIGVSLYKSLGGLEILDGLMVR
jgi:hypothetical protein